MMKFYSTVLVFRRGLEGGGGGVVSWYVPLARADLDYYMFFVGLRYPVLA